MGASPDRWSYYGAAHRHDVHGDPAEQLRCAQTMLGLRRQEAESELRRLTEHGDRCAFITLVEILVDADRTDDLRAMADAGDDRALVTLLELLCNQGRERELRAYVAAGRAHIGWLLTFLSSRGRIDDALAELAHWIQEHPDEAARGHALRLDLLVEHGRVDEVRLGADGGDPGAIRRMRRLRAGRTAGG